MRYLVGDLTIDVGTAQVERNGQPIALPRLSFDLLLALAREAPNVVNLDGLMTRVWPGLVVTPETVSQRVKLLRDALDDDPSHPRYIAGIRGRGYRMVASVTAIPSSPTPAKAVPPHEPMVSEGHATTGPSRPSRKTLFTAAAVALAVASTVAFWWLSRDYAPAASPAAASSVFPPRSVAVLPFDNVNGTAESDALAFGLVESVLHQLAAHQDLMVIARRSSFEFKGPGHDVREIGRQLNARYLLEGSLQSDARRLRVTAQFIDAADGSHLWSMQFDREPQDILAVQDEIAQKVAQAMQLTARLGERPGDPGTRNFDAYLAYSQALSRMASGRAADYELAADDLERAVRIDPQFAAAHVALAQALYLFAESDVSEQRGANVAAASSRARELLARALALDERNADAYFELGLLEEDTQRAETHLRHGLELNPSSAQGYASLGLLLWWRGDRNGAIEAFDRSYQLDPLSSDFANRKAMAALYARSNLAEAEQLSLKVLERDPSSSVALMRYGEVSWCCRAEFARGVQYIEQAVRNDPSNEFALRMLMRAYLDLEDVAEAGAVAELAPHSVGARHIALLLYARDFRTAARETYAAHERRTGEPIDDELRALAVRLDARARNDYVAARALLEERSGVSWTQDGAPTLGEPYDDDFDVALADMLQATGEPDRARRLLNALLARFDVEARELKRGEMWYLPSKAMAYAMLRRDDEALTTLERLFATGFGHDWWKLLELEPTFDRLRSNPRFVALRVANRKHVAEQQARLKSLRERGIIPHRSAAVPAR